MTTSTSSASTTVLYLFGIYGHPELSPAMQAVADAGYNVVVPSIMGYNGKPGFIAPAEYLDWYTIYWDAIDALGIDGPCHVVGASVGGMMAAELAILRPEFVRSVALLSPFGIFDASNPGHDFYSEVSPKRPPYLFAKGVPDAFSNRFAELGPTEAPISRYLADGAAANMLWPFGERGLGKRLHRITQPRLTMWGDQDLLSPVGLAEKWGGAHIVAGAGHLMEWDAPEEVGGALLDFLSANS
jgi:pimeloyl-ACP methyl ester carboxylesterase